MNVEHKVKNCFKRVCRKTLTEMSSVTPYLDLTWCGGGEYGDDRKINGGIFEI